MFTASSQAGCLQVVSFKMELSGDVSFEQDCEGIELAGALNAHLPSQAGVCSSVHSALSAVLSPYEEGLSKL